MSKDRTPASNSTERGRGDGPLGQRLVELARLFFTLGVVGFGGPAAHIAMMEEEVVHKRRWMTGQEFLDLVGATNLIPGPNSTEMTMHVGFARAGWIGLLVAGSSFIIPAAGLTLALTWFYVRTAAIPEAEAWISGIEPVVLVLIAVAVLRLGKKAVRTWPLASIALGVGSAVFVGVSEVPALLAGTFAGAVFLAWTRRREPNSSPDDGAPPPSSKRRAPRSNRVRWLLGGSFGAAAVTASEPTLEAIGLFFLKVGAVLYGSGYVLIAFLEGDLVHKAGWLTQGELLDVVAIGQLTPGPVLTTATAVGYVLAGFPGALVATVAIFLPAFLFVGLLHPIVPRIRSNRWMSAALDAVNAAAVALMAVVSLRLGIGVLATPVSLFIAVAAVGAVWSGRVPMPALIALGALAGGLADLL